MKKEKPLMKVDAYRVPRFQWGELIKSIFTLGFSNSKIAVDKALLYTFELTPSETVRIYSESVLGEQEEVDEFPMTQEEFEKLVIEDGKCVMSEHVYKFDQETIEKNR